MGKTVARCQTILDSSTATNNGGGGGDNWNSKKNKMSKSNHHHNEILGLTQVRSPAPQWKFRVDRNTPAFRFI